MVFCLQIGLGLGGVGCVPAASPGGSGGSSGGGGAGSSSGGLGNSETGVGTGGMPTGTGGPPTSTGVGSSTGGGSGGGTSGTEEETGGSTGCSFFCDPSDTDGSSSKQDPLGGLDHRVDVVAEEAAAGLDVRGDAPHRCDDVLADRRRAASIRRGYTPRPSVARSRLRRPRAPARRTGALAEVAAAAARGVSRPSCFLAAAPSAWRPRRVPMPTARLSTVDRTALPALPALTHSSK